MGRIRKRPVNNPMLAALLVTSGLIALGVLSVLATVTFGLRGPASAVFFFVGAALAEPRTSERIEDRLDISLPWLRRWTVVTFLTLVGLSIPSL
jgi:hypothetical protein